MWVAIDISNFVLCRLLTSLLSQFLVSSTLKRNFPTPGNEDILASMSLHVRDSGVT